MRLSVPTFVLASSLFGACAHRADAPAYVPAAPLPTLSVQRQLELQTGYEGAPGTMAFSQLAERCEVRSCVRDGRLAADDALMRLAVPEFAELRALPRGAFPIDIEAERSERQCRAEAQAQVVLDARVTPPVLVARETVAIVADN